jgi:AAA15 family ATPase/GTPase
MAKKTKKPNFLTNLTIKNFRCFEDFKLKDLKRVNIFVGDNNSGKSSVLEAVGFLYPTVRNYVNIVQSRESIIYRDSTMIGIRNGRTSISRFDYLFYKKKTENKIEIISELQDSEIKIALSIEKGDYFLDKHGDRNRIMRFGEDGPIFKEDIKAFIGNYRYKNISDKIGFSNSGVIKSLIEGFDEYRIELLFDDIPSTKEVAIKWNKIIENGGLEAEEKYIKLLQKFDPEITNIRIKLGEDLLFFKRDGYETNLSNMGNGFKKFFDIMLTAEIVGKASDKPKILCIDEIDNGLYHDKQDLFWEQIIKLCEEYNIQLFATTHSYDSLTNLNSFLQKKQFNDIIKIVRLTKFEEKILQTSFDQQELSSMIENHYEIR